MADLSNLGRYELRRTLGRGAMGVVYEGYDPKLGRKVAIKTILQGPDTDPAVAAEYASRFTREAKAAARLSHPNIVQVYDFGVESEVAYLVMEFVHGTELDAFFGKGERFDIGDAMRLMAELLDALELAHDAGVVHRDVKPANIMVDDEGHAKLADFGVARVSDGTDVSQAGTMVGTPAYMSPEQIQGQKIDRRTDLFSAGVVLYQFLTGQKPFQGGGVYTLARKILHDDPPAPSMLVQSISPEFDRVIARALAKVPGDRYQTAREFSDALNRALKSSPSNTLQKGAAQPAAGMPGTRPELELWRSVKDSDDIAQLRRYLGTFPDGAYAALAQRKIARLQGANPPAAEPAPVPAKPERPVAPAPVPRVVQEAPRPLTQAEAKALREAEAQRIRQKARADAQAEAQAQAKARPQATRRPAHAGIVRADTGIARPARPSAATFPGPGRGASMLVPAIVAIAIIAGGAMVYYMMQPEPSATERAAAQKAGTGKAAAGNAGAKAPAAN